MYSFQQLFDIPSGVMLWKPGEAPARFTSKFISWLYFYTTGGGEQNGTEHTNGEALNGGEAKDSSAPAAEPEANGEQDNAGNLSHCTPSFLAWV